MAEKDNKVLDSILNSITVINFRDKAGYNYKNERLKSQHYIVNCINEVNAVFKKSRYEIGAKNGKIYLFNGSYWKQLDEESVKKFLSLAAEKMGIDKSEAHYFNFKDLLMLQFITSSNISTFENTQSISINLENGTMDINLLGHNLRAARASDFLKYQLPFKFESKAQAPLFQAFLDQVLPDKSKQMIVAEFFGYLFIKSSVLKLEKILLFYGEGANGKSVIFEIINAMLGRDNVSNYSLSQLTDNTGMYRAKIEYKLLNYSSEINGKVGADIFKQLVSGEPVDARSLYRDPIIINNYAKLVFNCNSLPDAFEQNHAFFRRFLIIKFDITISEEKQDKQLSKKIIDSELPGVFNWVLDGLRRLNKNKKLTFSRSVSEQIIHYKDEADSLFQFLEDESLSKSVANCMAVKDLYLSYREYCNSVGFNAIPKLLFSKQLRKKGFDITRKTQGMVVLIEKTNV